MKFQGKAATPTLLEQRAAGISCTPINCYNLLFTNPNNCSMEISCTNVESSHSCHGVSKVGRALKCAYYAQVITKETKGFYKENH